MDITEFPEQTVVYAKDQPEYRNLPAHVVGDKEGTIICCWKLSEEEKQKVLETGEIWHSILTFNQPLQPQLLSVDKPFMEVDE
jgi:hypothetical protein